MQPAHLPRCGEQVDALAATAGPLTMTASFPSRVARSATAVVTGTVTVSAGRGVNGVASPEADVYVTRSGTVVATPVAKDLIGVPVRLTPGVNQEFRAAGSLRACHDGGRSAGAAGEAGPPLAPGRYELYAVVVVTDDGGSSTLAVGGPWPLEVT